MKIDYVINKMINDITLASMEINFKGLNQRKKDKN